MRIILPTTVVLPVEIAAAVDRVLRKHPQFEMWDDGAIELQEYRDFAVAVVKELAHDNTRP